MRRIDMRKSGLFDLEREVRGHRAAALSARPTPKPEPPRRAPAARQTAAFSYDGGEALELSYDPAYHAVTGEPAPPRTAAFTAEMHDGALSYFVEPFEDDGEPSLAASAPAPKPEPVESASVWAEAASLPEPAAEPVDDDELHRALEADLRTLLGEAFSAPEAAAPEPAPAPRREEPRAPEPPPPPPPAENRHAVFDQVGRALAFATTFNLPPVSLEQRFDDFDRVLEREESVRENVRAQKAQAAQPAPVAAALSLDSETLMNDLRMLGGGDFGAQRAPRPAPAAESFAVEPAAAPAEPARALAVAEVPAPPVEVRTVEPGPASFSSGEQSFHVTYDVPLIPQQTDMSCWAAGAAMVLAWRDNASIDPAAIGRAVGYVKQYQKGLPADDTRVLTAWGFTPEHGQTYTVEGFRRLLERHGPLWVASAEPGPHIRVVTGLSGDGTPDGTRVHINDPWEKGMNPFRLPNAGAQYQETYREFEAKQAQLARTELHLQGIYVAHL